jgi:hypothetical protein
MSADRQWRDLWVKSALCIGGCVFVFGGGFLLNGKSLPGNSGSPEPVIKAAMHAPGKRLTAGTEVNKLQPFRIAEQSTAHANNMACTFAPVADSCAAAKGQLCDADLEAARIAWKYFENNYQPTTGLTNSVNQYTSTTMWDTGSALAATIAARDFELISQKEFDDRVVALLGTLQSMPLYNNEAPNKAYSTVDASMVDYTNQPTSTGIGVSTLDLARLVSWLNTLSCQHSKYERSAQLAIERWNFDRLLADNQMYGLAHDYDSGEGQVLQEGRLGYEQYGGKVFSELGFEQNVSSRYNNRFKQEIDIYGVPVAYDSRDPQEFGAYNYVVTESYALDVMEHGHDLENTLLMDNIFGVQKKRWQETGIVTAVSEDNVDRAPWFVYNTIFTAGLPWSTITDTGERHPDLTSVSTKAAFSIALLYPQDPYSDVLMRHIESAYDVDNGWYSGVYENGSGYNKAITANTNGIILSGLLYKKYGPMYEMCNACNRSLALSQEAYPQKRACGTCSTALLNSELNY